MHATKEQFVIEKILGVLKAESQGLTIGELALASGVHRQTCAKYLLELVALGKIRRRIIGPVALHYTADERRKREILV